MRLFTFILLSLISLNAFADGLSNFEKYKENFPLLVNDIQRMESVVQKNNAPLYQEMLRSMNVFKEHFDHLSNPLKLEAFLNDAKDKGWKNIERMTNELISRCESKTETNMILCKEGLEGIKNLALNSKLTKENKEAVAIFIDDYLNQLNALRVVNTEFIQTFNQNVENINLKIKEAVKRIPPIVVKVKPVSNSVLIARSFKPSNQNYLFMAILALGVVLTGRFFIQYLKSNKNVKGFYLKLFTLGQKNNLHLKVFGHLSYKEAALVEKIQAPFLNTIYLSRVVSNKVHVKLKNKGNGILIEVNYFTSRALQNVLGLPKEKALKESVDALQEIVEKSGGDFIFSNRFNSAGELVQSSLLLQVLKQEA